MCGIVAYAGTKNALPILLDGLQRLEYRGYDSAGIFISNPKKDTVLKVKGKVNELRLLCDKETKEELFPIGLGHTRWATHGKPNESNAHPHVSNNKELILVHNGIIENYETLKKDLIQRGYTFESDTDSEVLINLFEEIQKTQQVSLEAAVQIGLNRVIGAYGIVVFDKKKPHELIVARLGSPLAIGIGKNDFFVGSDATPFLEHTKEVVYLNDFEMARLSFGEDIQVSNFKENTQIKAIINQLTFDLEHIQKDGFDHFMLKEIFEQPKAIENSLRGRIDLLKEEVQLDSVQKHESIFKNTKRIIILGCGTSWHAGLVGEYLLEKFTRIPTEVEYASEFRYRDPIIHKDDLVIPISQSGETADTMAALKLAKDRGAFIFGICNVVGSSISRETDSGMYTHAGPEIGVASTKAFTTQITVLILLSLKIAALRNTIQASESKRLLDELIQIPDLISSFLKQISEIKEIAKIYHKASNMLYLGRGFNFPVALEGALKLKEISYIHAEGYPAAEMKHGPIALIDKEMPVIVIATKKGHYDKIVSNVQEIRSRGAKIISIVSSGDESIKKMSDHSIEIPESDEIFSPLFATIPLQLLSYYIAILRNCNVDQPRNLAKSVTVE
jgi:glucosamine--fructose-6-phosphate aminotransferase (isomerizing)